MNVATSADRKPDHVMPEPFCANDTGFGVKVNRQPGQRSLIRLAPWHTGKLVGELRLGRFPQSQNVFGRKHVG